MIIQTQNKEAFDLSFLTVLVLRFIYEPETLSLFDIHRMQNSLIIWSKTFPITDSELARVEALGWMLKKNEEGGFDTRKKLFREKDINWRKFHRLPGANTFESIFKAKQMYDEYKRKNPEQEEGT